MDCVFCVKVEMLDEVFFTSVTQVFRFEPLNPVVPGHMLFVPRVHCEDAAANPRETGYVMQAASLYAREQEYDFNLITSAGKNATQSIEHLHIHYVPRRENDGLHLPWTGQVE